MNQTTNTQNASCLLITTSSFDSQSYKLGIKTQTDSDYKCYTSQLIPQRANISSLDDFLKSILSDPTIQEDAKSSRAWVADTFYERPSIKVFRLKAGLSQTELARLMNTSQAQIAKIEKGDQDIMYSTLKKLSVALGVTLNDLDEALSS